jgi:hypothetical protein
MLEKGEITEGIVKVEQILKAAKVSSPDTSPFVLRSSSSKDCFCDRLQEGTLKVICFNGVRGIFEAFIEI